MRLIDADELMMQVFTVTRTESNARMLDLLTGLIADAQTACEWHCVADELPHDDTTVLIAHRAGVSTGWFNGRYWEQGAGTGHRMLKTVTHWMPLPKPPERKTR